MTTNTNPHFPYAVAEPATAVLAEHLAYLRRTQPDVQLPGDWLDVLADADSGTEPLSRGQIRELISYFA